MIADIAALPPALYLRESAAVVVSAIDRRESNFVVSAISRRDAEDTLRVSEKNGQEPETQAQRPRIVSGKLTLEADKVRFNPQTMLTELEGNVVATYGGAKLSSVNAEINHDTKHGWFRNTVRLEDELGVMTASEIFIDWSNPNAESVKGHAKNVVLDAYEAHFEAEEISLTGDGGAQMQKAWFSTAPGYYRLLLDGVVIRPGQYISAKKAVLQLGKGLRIPIPFFRVNLNPTITGIQSPVPKIDEDFRLGYSWAQVLQFSEQLKIHLNQRGAQGRVPSVNGQIIYEVPQPTLKREMSDAERQLQMLRAPVNQKVLPKNEDLERFTQGYFDNVTVKTLQDETSEIAQRHMIFFAGHTMNISTKARPGNAEDLDRPFYAGFQSGGSLGKLAMLGQLRYGMVHERLSEEKHQRAEFLGTALLPVLNLGSNLSLRFRADVGAYTGEGVDFGWVRPMAQIVAMPSKEVTLGLAYFRAQEWGSPLFDADRLYSKKGLHLRMDFDLAATDISLLLKYDFDRKDIYDIEVALEQVMPVITPFISYRKFPGTFAFGFKLRADNLLRALKSREIVRRGSGGQWP